jgi:RimJ/RimL family protein N-acetyltransferase
VLIHDAWGRGYAREAVDAVVEHLLASGVTDVLAYVDPRNERSLALLDHLGFARVGEEDGDVVFRRR